MLNKFLFCYQKIVCFFFSSMIVHYVQIVTSILNAYMSPTDCSTDNTISLSVSRLLSSLHARFTKQGHEWS